MSSSTATIPSENSSMNNNDRKRPIPSSIRSSPPLSAKRHTLSSSKVRRSERNKILMIKSNDQNERQSRLSEQYQPMDSKNSSLKSNRSSPNSNYLIKQERKSETINKSYFSIVDVKGMLSLASKLILIKRQENYYYFFHQFQIRIKASQQNKIILI